MCASRYVFGNVVFPKDKIIHFQVLSEAILNMHISKFSHNSNLSKNSPKLLNSPKTPIFRPKLLVVFHRLKANYESHMAPWRRGPGDLVREREYAGLPVWRTAWEWERVGWGACPGGHSMTGIALCDVIKEECGLGDLVGDLLW